MQVKVRPVKLKKCVVRCAECGGRFEQRKSWQRFCSALCRWKSWAREHPRMKLEEGISGEYENR